MLTTLEAFTWWVVVYVCIYMCVYICVYTYTTTHHLQASSVVHTARDKARELSKEGASSTLVLECLPSIILALASGGKMYWFRRPGRSLRATSCKLCSQGSSDRISCTGTCYSLSSKAVLKHGMRQMPEPWRKNWSAKLKHYRAVSNSTISWSFQARTGKSWALFRW